MVRAEQPFGLMRGRAAPKIAASESSGRLEESPSGELPASDMARGPPHQPVSRGSSAGRRGPPDRKRGARAVHEADRRLPAWSHHARSKRRTMRCAAPISSRRSASRQPGGIGSIAMPPCSRRRLEHAQRERDECACARSSPSSVRPPHVGDDLPASSEAEAAEWTSGDRRGLGAHWARSQPGTAS